MTNEPIMLAGEIWAMEPRRLRAFLAQLATKPAESRFGDPDEEEKPQLKIEDGVALGGLNLPVGVTPSEGGWLQATRKRNSRNRLAFQMGLKINSTPVVEKRVPFSI